MTAIQQAQSAYRDQSGGIRTQRSLEYDAFARVTHRLRSAAETRDRDFARLAQALHDNRRLWTILASDVADSSNPLPPELRARIVSLAEFVRLHGSKVLNGRADVDALIEVNRAVMRGLDSRAVAQ